MHYPDESYRLSTTHYPNELSKSVSREWTFNPIVSAEQQVQPLEETKCEVEVEYYDEAPVFRSISMAATAKQIIEDLAAPHGSKKRLL